MEKKYFILFICSVIFLTVVSVSIAIFSNSGEGNLNEKAQQELQYIESKLLGMINSLNNVTFSNSVLLEHDTIKSEQNNNSSSSSSNDKSNDQQQKQGSGSSSQNSSEGGSTQNEKITDYTKYNIENTNILIQTDITIDWNYLKDSIETLYSSWPTVMIDLHSLNVKNDDVFLFSNTLDSLVISIENENKKDTLNNLSVLYSLIPIYLEQFTDNTDIVNIAYTKSCIINSYVLLEDEKWDEMQAQIAKALEYFDSIINSINNNIQQNSISKTYIALNEMKNVINLKDKKLFYLKYINLMENALLI